MCLPLLGVLQAVESEEELDSALTAKFCQVPLYPLKDMEKWFHFLIIFDSQFLAGLQVRLGNHQITHAPAHGHMHTFTTHHLPHPVHCAAVPGGRLLRDTPPTLGDPE